MSKSPSNQDSSVRDTVSSANSNLSTATDRLKRILKKQPVHINGVGFSETPFQRMLIEDEKNKPQRKMDYILGVDRTQKFLNAVNSQRDKERELYDSLARSLKPLVIEKAKQNTEHGR
jgi:hypothetical protein